MNLTITVRVFNDHENEPGSYTERMTFGTDTIMGRPKSIELVYAQVSRSIKRAVDFAAIRALEVLQPRRQHGPS